MSLTGADTVAVFGDLIHTYDILQSQRDKATVPIYYEPRQVKLHLSDADLDAILKEATEEYEPTEVEKRKSRWATLAAAARAQGIPSALGFADVVNPRAFGTPCSSQGLATASQPH